MIDKAIIGRRRGRIASRRQVSGVVVLEALIAILIFSMGILAVIGLQAAMMKGASDARYRAEATFIAQQKLGEIWTNAKKRDALSGYAEDEEDISNLLPGGKRMVEIASAPQCLVTVTVTWQLADEEVHRHRTLARLNSVLDENTCIYKI